MRCPSCGHEQPNATECSKCGIIFSRFLKRREARAEHNKPQTGPPASSRQERRRFGWLAACLLSLLAGGGGTALYFRAGSGPPPPVLPVQTAGKAVAVATPPVPAASRTATARGMANISGPQPGLIGQFAAAYAPHNAIEQARNATVYIKTPWGSGSGFFLSPAGHLITNRHVVQFDPATLKKLQDQNAHLAEQLAEEQRNIRYFKKRLAGISDQEVRRQVEQQLQRRQQAYEKYSSLHRQVQDKLQEISRANWVADIKVFLIDGSEFAVQSLRMSERADLALLTIDCVNAPALKPAVDSQAVPQGEKVYTIGNPAGLRHTVTSGIVSGYRTYQGNTYVQTDAPINPGNSGGPLIDAEGRLIGVNTMIVRDTEGIGFAIPYRTVREEFGFYLPDQ